VYTSLDVQEFLYSSLLQFFFYCPRILLFGWLHFFQKWIFWISFSGVPIQFGLEFGLGRSADEDFWSIKK